MKTSRHQILDFIIQKRRATPLEISRVFQMSAANARYHLSILEQEGLIEATDQKPFGNKGRPARIYSPSQKLIGNNLNILAAALLEIIKLGDVSPDMDQRIEQLAGAVATRMGKTELLTEQYGSSTGTMTARLNRLTKHLNIYKYMARWEAHSGSPHIIFENCPYLPVIHEFPDLCKMDALIIKIFIDYSAYQIQKIELDSFCKQVCRFSIGKQCV